MNNLAPGILDLVTRFSGREKAELIAVPRVDLAAEVGEPRATRLRRLWAGDWWQGTGVCPYCGERGPYDDPDAGGGERPGATP